RAIGVVPLYDAPEVKTHDVTLADLALGRWDPVDDLLVDRDAGRRGESPVALEGRGGPFAMDVGLDVLVDLERRHPRADEASQPAAQPRRWGARPPHERDLARRLEHDHRPPPAALRIASRIVASGPSPATVVSMLRWRE